MSKDEIKDDCMKALFCLHIAVDEEVARDVNTKVKAFIEQQAKEIISLQMISDKNFKNFLEQAKEIESLICESNKIDQLQTLRTQNERLVKALDRALSWVPYSYRRHWPDDVTRKYEEAKALLAEVRPVS